MGVPVVLTEQSLQDLAEVVSFIARDNPGKAEAFGNELIDHALGLGNLPEMGRQVPEFGDPEVREIIYHSYRIVYTTGQEPRGIFVIRFWHAARGAPEIPGQEQ